MIIHITGYHVIHKGEDNEKILIIILSLILIAGCTDNSSISPDNEAEDALNDNQETEDTLNDNQETENSNEPIMVPDFELETLDGSVIKLSEIRDKNVIINFWYTGCTFCVMEMPDLQKLQETYPDDLCCWQST